MEQEMPVIRISVRNLVEFILREGEQEEFWMPKPCRWVERSIERFSEAWVRDITRRCR